MRTTASPSRRWVTRGAACEEPPRLWGGEPCAAAVVPMAVPAEPVAREAAAAPAAPSAPTLGDLISGAWDGLVAAGPVACPVCAATMELRWSAGAGVVGGRCGGCGSTLE